MPDQPGRHASASSGSSARNRLIKPDRPDAAYLSAVNDLVAAPNGAGAALVLVGIATAAVTFRQSERSVRAERGQLAHTLQTYENDAERRERALKEAGISYATWGDMLFLRQDIQLAAIKEAKPGLNLAIILTVVGTFASLVSAVLSVGH